MTFATNTQAVIEQAGNKGAMLFGLTDKRGLAYGYNMQEDGSLPANHYAGAVPMSAVREFFDWSAVETPITYPVAVDSLENASGIDADGMPYQNRTSATRKLLVHSKTGLDLGVHGSGRQTFQYQQIVDTTAAIVTAEGLAVTDDTLNVAGVGTFAGGARMWLQLEGVEGFETPEGVEFAMSMFIRASHDGAWKPEWLTVGRLLKCTNEIPSLKRGASASYGRKATSGANLDQIALAAKGALGLVHSNAATFGAGISELLRKETTGRDFENFLKVVAPSPEDDKTIGVLTGNALSAYQRSVTRAANVRGELRALRNDDRCSDYFDDKGNGSEFALFNLANTHRLWMSTVKGAKTAEDRTDRNRLALLSGTAQTADNKIFAQIEKALATV
jgi:hypothetical protein